MNNGPESRQVVESSSAAEIVPPHPLFLTKDLIIEISKYLGPRDLSSVAGLCRNARVKSSEDSIWLERLGRLSIVDPNVPNTIFSGTAKNVFIQHFIAVRARFVEEGNFLITQHADNPVVSDQVSRLQTRLPANEKAINTLDQLIDLDYTLTQINKRIIQNEITNLPNFWAFMHRVSESNEKLARFNQISRFPDGVLDGLDEHDAALWSQVTRVTFQNCALVRFNLLPNPVKILMSPEYHKSEFLSASEQAETLSGIDQSLRNSTIPLKDRERVRGIIIGLTLGQNVADSGAGAALVAGQSSGALAALGRFTNGVISVVRDLASSTVLARGAKRKADKIDLPESAKVEKPAQQFQSADTAQDVQPPGAVAPGKKEFEESAAAGANAQPQEVEVPKYKSRRLR